MRTLNAHHESCTFMLKSWISSKYSLSRSYHGVHTVLQSSLLYSYFPVWTGPNTACVHRFLCSLVTLSFSFFTLLLNIISLHYVRNMCFSHVCGIFALNFTVPVFSFSFCTLGLPAVWLCRAQHCISDEDV